MRVCVWEWEWGWEGGLVGWEGELFTSYLLTSEKPRLYEDAVQFITANKSFNHCNGSTRNSMFGEDVEKQRLSEPRRHR